MNRQLYQEILGHVQFACLKNMHDGRKRKDKRDNENV